ncbi:SDR family NAD(P)-dependent oxidoreductase [Radiobacillus sp. PE A8.2]|uniref:SDR family NAD(P)-dependent oxidoreductase n=1 Tax=Radiobacillus sp. PE A8.2 TaxID=3380349 RepID=UPI00388DDCAC
MKVANKVIVVTGGGGGIGRELVLNLLAKGASVAAVDINLETLSETVSQAGEHADKLSTHIVDIQELEDVEALPRKVIEHHGAVDGIINNAGIIQPFVDINELDFDRIKRVIDINFYGTLYMTKTFLPYLLERPVGHITNVSSMGGFLPVPGQSIYGASKAAVKLMTEGLYAELLDTNVNVTVVFPGGVDTNITKSAGMGGLKDQPMDEKKKTPVLLAPQEAAEIIIDGMEKDLYRVLAGKDAKFMDKLYRFNPKRATAFISKRMKFFK